LIEVRDADVNSTAIEVTAGGKLFNVRDAYLVISLTRALTSAHQPVQVVIQDEDTGKKLLAGGNLQKRVTFIPLNKIDSSRSLIPPGIVQKAKQLVGADNVTLALSLVGYDAEVKAAMEFCFGSTLVCKGTTAASSTHWLVLSLLMVAVCLCE